MSNHILDRDLHGLPVQPIPTTPITARQDEVSRGYTGPLPAAQGFRRNGHWIVSLGAAFACPSCGIACDSAEAADKCCKPDTAETVESIRVYELRCLGMNVNEISQETGRTKLEVSPLIQAADARIMSGKKITRFHLYDWLHERRRENGLENAP